MAKNGNGSKKRRKHVEDEPADEKPKKPGVFASMKPETVRGIAGVLLFVLTIVLVLSGADMAGPFGTMTYKGLYTLVGIGFWLLPFMVGAWAISLFKSNYSENNLRPIRTAGALIGYVAMLTILHIVSSGSTIGGMVGAFIAQPLVGAVETVAALVILAGIVVVALLLLFDSELWVLIGKRIAGLFKRQPKEGETPDGMIPLSDDEPDVPPLTPEEIAAAMPAKAVATEPLPEPLAPKLSTYEDGNVDTYEEFAPPAPKQKQKQVYELPSAYNPPPISFLESDRGKANVGDTKHASNMIRNTLQHFRIAVEMDEITAGPTVTRYALKPAEGVKLSRITQLQQNLELALAASPLRIEAPIPGRSLVGIEVPNKGKAIVGLAGLLAASAFNESKAPLLFALGKDIAGGMHYADIAEMPHLLIAGATKSGKSVMVHTLITSLLYRNGPERLNLILVDPKQVELTLYEDLPHLLTHVITEPKKCISALTWAGKEMERRYGVLREHKVRDVGEFHDRVLAPAVEAYEKAKDAGEDLEGLEPPERLPHMVIIIDELADIMSAYPRELEAAIVRLAQKSRAVGIHLILSTQRPSAEVVTGLIKANMPARIALKVSSGIESRIILDELGAEKLLGYGDMLYKAADMPKPRRIQSPFLTSDEVKKIVAYLTKHNDTPPENVKPIFEEVEGGAGGGGFEDDGGDDLDAIYEDVRQFVLTEKKASTSLIQRRFKVGYGRAARIMDQLTERGIIEPSDNTNRPRALRAEYMTGGDGADERA